MTRIEFTEKICKLLLDMISAGDAPQLDEVKRGMEQQKIYFDKGWSKCDGVKILSDHQKGTAADIDFPTITNPVDNEKAYLHWHDVWQRVYGGRAPFKDKHGNWWDLRHFEA